MQSSSSTHLPDENGTPQAQSRPSRAPFSLTCNSTMPPGERDQPLPAPKRPVGVQPDGKKAARGAILSIGDDPDLLMTRHWVLESAGYQVHSVSGDAALDDDVISMIDLAIICHSVREDHAAAAVSSLRKRKPSLPIVLLNAAFRRQSIGDEVAVLVALAGPQTLLTQIRSILAGCRNPATGTQA